MPVNLDKPHLWKDDVRRSVDFYNDWFMRFAPEAYREQRTEQARIVEEALKRTNHLKDISPELLKAHPSVLTLLRAATAPPIARDRLIGLAYVTKNLVESMEGKDNRPPRIPPMMKESELVESLERIGKVIEQLADRDLLNWLDNDSTPQESDIHRASTVLADRLCGAAADPIIRNAQEKRQLALFSQWLESREYRYVKPGSITGLDTMEPGTFTFRLNVSASHGKGKVNIPVDAVIMPMNARAGDLPLFIEAKSAGDFTNTNKRRKEEAQKATQLRTTYGASVRFILFLCGYFGADYLGYMAAEGVDWVWEHRVDDLALFGLLRSTGGDNPDNDISDSDGNGSNNPPDHPDPDWNFSGIVKEPEAEPEGTEAQRMAAQAQLDARKSAEERNRLGQFATPPKLARMVAREALRLCSVSQTPIRFLDPSVGTGSFFSALLDTCDNDRIEYAEGIEIDSHVAQTGSQLWESMGLQVKVADFTRTPPPDYSRRFNLILANPPYVRHHHIPVEDKARIRAEVRRRLQIECNGLSGLYTYFILLAHDWMQKEAVAAWLIPTEFMDVGYGKSIRDYLAREVTLLRIHRFSAEDRQFDDALVSSAVLLFKNAPPPPGHSARLTYGGTLEAPLQCRNTPVSELALSQKWNQLFRKQESQREKNTVAANGHGIKQELTLGDLFIIKRGLATGANNFFIMSRSEAEERNLPPEFLQPILPSPRLIKDSIINIRSDGTPDLEKEMVLLSCHLSEQIVQQDYPTLWAYLQEGKTQGIAERYLCSKRSPWYAQERREPAPILCSYMGRSKGKVSPLRFFLNRSKALATNVYLNLYPRPVLARLLQRDPDVIATVWQIMSKISAESIAAGGRVYGGGLHKAEPGELAALHIPGLVPEAFYKTTEQQSELLFR